MSSKSFKISLIVNILLIGGIVFIIPQLKAPCVCPTTTDYCVLNAETPPATASTALVITTSLKPPPVLGLSADRPREEGWVGSIARIPTRTSRTFYDPANDAELLSGIFPKSLTPLPSLTVTVRPGRTINMDDAVHAYDIWFEEHAVYDRLSWLGVSMQQDPADAMTIQQMLYHVKPDLVIELGTNTGGGAIFYSSIMRTYNPKAKVVTVDPRPISNWRDGAATGEKLTFCDRCILGNEHPYWTDGGIDFIQGMITGNDCPVVDKLQKYVDKAKTVLVIEDSNHAQEVVTTNIEALHKFVSVNSYLLIQDTKLTRLEKKRKHKGKSGPLPSVEAFINKHENFVVDRRYEYLMYSQHHWGWLRKTREE